jgi:hypothetical protein
MTKLDPDALYHRTLNSLPEGFTQVPRDPYLLAVATLKRITAYTIRGKKLVPIECFQKKDLNFKTYATPWEILHSKLPFGSGSGKADPVVDENRTVVGHVGWYETDSIFVPARAMKVTKKVTVMVAGQGRAILSMLTDRDPLKAAEENRQNLIPKPQVREVTRGLGELLRDGVEVHADDYNQFYLKQGYTCPYAQHKQTAYRIVTDPEGRAQYLAEVRDREAIEASWVSPLDLICIVRLAVLAGVAVTSVAIRALARPILMGMLRGAASDAAGDTLPGIGPYVLRAGARDGAGDTLRGIGAFAARTILRRRVGAMTADELQAYLAQILSSRPDLQRLMAARLMSGEGRINAIRAALREFTDTQHWTVAEKTTAQMEAMGLNPANLAQMRSATRELWIVVDREPLDSPEFYDELVHDLSAHALAGRGGSLGPADLPFFVGLPYSRVNNGLFALQNAIQTGDLARVIAFMCQ